MRGPYLGRLELHHTMTELNENANELLGDFLELLVEYFRKVRPDLLIKENDITTLMTHSFISLVWRKTVLCQRHNFILKFLGSRTTS